jgi:hypothetical protein
LSGKHGGRDVKSLSILFHVLSRCARDDILRYNYHFRCGAHSVNYFLLNKYGPYVEAKDSENSSMVINELDKPFLERRCTRTVRTSYITVNNRKMF